MVICHALVSIAHAPVQRKGRWKNSIDAKEGEAWKNNVLENGDWHSAIHYLQMQTFAYGRGL